MREKIIKLYTYEELSDSAKEEARDKYRHWNVEHDWWDCAYEDFALIGECLGIEFMRRKSCNTKGEPTWGEPRIFFNGFGTQGDGASYEADWHYRTGWRKALGKHMPDDEELLRIGRELQEAARRAKWNVYASAKSTGNYHRLEVEVYAESVEGFGHQADIEEALRDFASWMFRQLSNEYDYLTSDEVVESALIGNEVEFEEE